MISIQRGIVMVVGVLWSTLPRTASADVCEVDLTVETSDLGQTYRLIVGESGGGLALCLAPEPSEEDAASFLLAEEPRVVAHVAATDACVTTTGSRRARRRDPFTLLEVVVAGHNVVVDHRPDDFACSDFDAIAPPTAGPGRAARLAPVGLGDIDVEVLNLEDDSTMGIYTGPPVEPVEAYESAMEAAELDMLAPEGGGAPLGPSVSCSLGSYYQNANYGRYNSSTTTVGVCGYTGSSYKMLCTFAAPAGGSLFLYGNSLANEVRSPIIPTACGTNGSISPWYGSWTTVPTLYGYAGGDTLYGAGSSSILHGGDDADTLNGSNGRDWLYGEGAGNTINGYDGDDYIYGGPLADVIDAGKGSDYVESYAGGDLITGGDGWDDIWAGPDVDYVSGGDGEDYVWGEEGGDYIWGDDDDDWAYGGPGNDHIWGGLGYDTLIGQEHDDVIHGGEYSDVIIGDSGNDELYGDAGNDMLFGSTGDDWIEGGPGDDWIYGGYWTSFQGPPDLTIDSGQDRLFGDTASNCTDTGADHIYTGWDTDCLSGAGKKNYVVAGPGDDTVDGAGCPDVILGDCPHVFPGHDFLPDDSVAHATTQPERWCTNELYQDYPGHWIADQGCDAGGVDIIAGGGGTDFIHGCGGVDDLYGDHNGFGTPAGDYIDGGCGDDFVHGDEGDDQVSGDTRLCGCPGSDDTVHGDDGVDQVAGDCYSGYCTALRSCDAVGGNDHVYGDDPAPPEPGSDTCDDWIGTLDFDESCEVISP